jgi:uncharacterized protein YbjQ (UPF0145 family)
MKRSIASAVSLGCALGVAAGLAHGADAAQVKVFDATQLTLDRYSVVTRVWTQAWRSAFWVPEYGTAADAIDALISKAAGAGADGVINLHCLNDTGGWGSGYICYGLAIKLK